MKSNKRNRIIIISSVIVCLLICILWATVFFVRRADQTESSLETSSESSDISSDEPIEFPDALDALLKCDQRVLQSASFSSETNGFFNTRVMFFEYKNEMYSQRIVTQDEMYFEDLGVGTLLRYGVARYIKKDTFLVRVGDAQTLDRVEWNEKPISVSDIAYQSAFGDTPRGLSEYILQKDTIKSAKMTAYSEDTYTFVYELVPDAADLARKKKLQTLSALESTPSIRSVKMTVIMDRDFYPLSVTYTETYSVTLPILGESTCTAEYTETFSSFEENISVPDQAYYLSFLNLAAVGQCPRFSSGYQLLLSLFEDRTAYELSVSTGDFVLPAEISTDLGRGALCVQSNAFLFLYQDQRYHLSYDNVCVYTEADALNEYILPLFAPAPSVYRAQDNMSADFLSGADIKTENGKLIISSDREGNAFQIVIDTATMSLVDASFSVLISDNTIDINLKKTIKTMVIPDVSDYENISEAISAVSFLNPLFSGADLRYALEMQGNWSYSADIVLSLDQNLAFSAIATSDTLPINLYFADEKLHAVLDEISLYGSFEEYSSLLTAFSNGGIATANDTRGVRLASVEHSVDLLTLHFEGEDTFSLTLSSDTLVLQSGSLAIRLKYCGISETTPLSAPSVQNELSVSDLGVFLTGSVYPSLLGANGIGAEFDLDIGQETLSGEVLLNFLPVVSARLDTNWNGLDLSLLYQNNTVYLCNQIFDGFVQADRFDAVLNRFNGVSGWQKAQPMPASASQSEVISCNGETLQILYNGIAITLYKDFAIVTQDDMTVKLCDLHALSEPAVIVPPSKEECIDIDLLSERLVPIIEQNKFSFAGEVAFGGVSANVSRLDICMEELFEISAAAIDFSIGAEGGLYQVVYADEAICFEKDNIKLFSLAKPLLNSLSSNFAPMTVSARSRETQMDFDAIHSVTFQNDVLTVSLESVTLCMKLTLNGIEWLNIASDLFSANLNSTVYRSIVLPHLEGYTDITDIADLIPAVLHTYNAGNLRIDGEFNLRVLSMRLKGVIFSGTLDFSDGEIKGYICIDVPYLYGLSSNGIPLQQDNSLLRYCAIKNEIFLMGDTVYIHRTVEALYGYSQPIEQIYHEKRYIKLEDLLHSPDVVFDFVLNLESDLCYHVDENKETSLYQLSKPVLFHRVEKCENKYTLEINPEAIGLLIDRVALFAQTDGGYLTILGIEASESEVDLVLRCRLSEHGESKLSFSESDFLSYIPLQDE